MREVVAGSLAFAERFDLGAGDAERTAKYGSTAAVLQCHFFPIGLAEAAVQPLADFSAWAYAAEDAMQPGIGALDVTRMACRYYGILNNPDWCAPAGDNLEEALRDCLMRLRPTVTDYAYRWFTQWEASWIKGLLWESTLLAGGEVLGVADFLPVRIAAVGVYGTYAYHGCFERAQPWLWSAPLARAASECGILVAGLDNDRYSYFKESQLKPGTSYSLFECFRVDDPTLTVRDSLAAGVSLRDALLGRYLQLRERILASGTEQEKLLVAAVDLTIAGNVRMGLTTLRYAAPQLSQARIVDEAPPAPDAPPPYPAVAWYWNV
ncbi:MAG TPA: terpene synthase family protein [Actinophytocola sp.]|nr:terpene synthase family protein [Actinophytocola sp.]